MTIGRVRTRYAVGAGAFACLLAAGFAVTGSAFTRLTNGGCESEGYPTTYLAWPPVLRGGGAVQGGIFINPNCADTGCPGSTERDAVIRAMDRWNAAPFNFTFVFSGDTTLLPYDGDPSVDPWDDVSVSGWSSIDGPGGIVAQTWVIFECWGEIVEADIQFDDDQEWSSEGVPLPGAFDVETVAMHELGHVLGLDHSDPPAIMQPTVSSGTLRLDLTQDDINGGIAIYGTPPSQVERFELYE